MVNMLEEAILYATIMHQGRTRKIKNIPYILHPLEVAQILSTMTEDQEVITAGVLHDIVEETDGTLDEIRKRFGFRVAMIVESETEEEYPGEDRASSWKKRKEGALTVLKNSTDIGVKMLWLADKLANIRSLARTYSEQGDKLWSYLHQGNPQEQCWYYRTVAEYVELKLNRTGAFKEYIKHVNFIWPGTFDMKKARYQSYREISVEGCRLLGRGSKGSVYRYNDELVVKVYNDSNTYHEVEQEVELCRRAFVAGLPTAISFGIASVGESYGALFELFEANTISEYIAQDPGKIDYYAKVMAALARQIHGTKAKEHDIFPPVSERLLRYVDLGIAKEDAGAAGKLKRMIRETENDRSLVHGDFHTGNVFLQNGEPLLIDMDSLSVGNPLVDVSGIYLYYEGFVKWFPDEVEQYMGFSNETSEKFCKSFFREYLMTEDEERLQRVQDQAVLLADIRMLYYTKTKKKKEFAREDMRRYLTEEIRELLGRVDTFVL